MKLYLSSAGIPSPDALASLLQKPLATAAIAIIPNSKDCYVERARDCLIDDFITYMKQFSSNVETVDLRNFSDAKSVEQKLAGYDLIWAMGGNTFNLRYEMQRSGFDEAIRPLFERGVVYGGHSAGALVAGLSIAGIETADRPEFAEQVITDGLGLIPCFILPHADDPAYTAKVASTFRSLHEAEGTIITLTDSQAILFDGMSYRIVDLHNNAKEKTSSE